VKEQEGEKEGENKRAPPPVQEEPVMQKNSEAPNESKGRVLMLFSNSYKSLWENYFISEKEKVANGSPPVVEEDKVPQKHFTKPQVSKR
jgi:hypothetical protein